jgi:cell division protein YceG involved in septum cleavage
MKTLTSKSWIMLALALLASGAVAWLAVFAFILLTTQDSADPAGPDPAPELVAGVPTLAAVTGTPSIAPIPTDTPSATPVPSLASSTPTLTAAPANTSSAPLPVPSATPLPASAEPSTPATKACPPPEGWEPYIVQPDDTLFAFVLGAGGTITVDDLVNANCLTSRFLSIDQVLYLPPGAAENAPPSSPVVSGSALMAQGPRTPACPCTISIPEGWRREQIAEAVSAAQTMFTGGDFLAVTDPGASAPFDFVMERPAGASLEGFLFPGSYTVQNDTTAEQFRDMLLSAFAANITAQMRADAAAQGVTFYQALIIASVIQREVRSPDTQKLVASVIYNRYRDGNRLAATVTVQYALGGPGNWWPRVTGEGLKVDSPYNSYTLPGLPPGPIDSPGLSAILAAIYPAQTDYYYHTQACDGSGEAFAVTYEEHLANVNCE